MRRKVISRGTKWAEGITITVHPDFYKRIEDERIKFIQKHKLNKLTTVAFTGILNRKELEKRLGVKKKRGK